MAASLLVADRNKRKHRLSVTLGSGGAVVVELPQDVQLGDKRGIITLLDDRGLKIDGVAYTCGQGKREGRTIVF